MTDFQEYRLLIGKLASDVTPSAADKKKLAGLIASLEFNIERAEADVATMRRAAELAPIAATSGDAIAEREAIAEDGAAFDAKHAEYMTGYRAGWNALQSRAMTAKKKEDSATEAKNALRELHQQHWKLFALPDPADTAKKRHLIQIVFHRAKILGGIHPIELEQIMRNPGGHRFTAIDPADILPHEGQPDEVFAAIVASARALSHANLEGRYLVTPTELAMVRECSDLCIGVADVNPDFYSFSTRKLRFLPVAIPGQSPDDLAERTQDFIRRMEKTHANLLRAAELRRKEYNYELNNNTRA